MRRLATALLMAALGAGCVHKYEVPEGGAPRLARDATVYVTVPEPGRFEGQVFPESGVQVARAVGVAIQFRGSRSVVASAAGTPEENLKAARAAGATHVAVPTILHWEERATEWSGKSDRVRLRLELIDTANGVTIDSSEVSGKSRWATLGGDHPQDLLPEPLALWAARFLGPGAD